jgi:hypothetical protein
MYITSYMRMPATQSFLSEDYIVSKEYATGHVVLAPKNEQHLATLIFLTDRVHEHFDLFATQNMVPLSTKVVLVQPRSLKAAANSATSKGRAGRRARDQDIKKDIWFEILSKPLALNRNTILNAKSKICQ